MKNISSQIKDMSRLLFLFGLLMTVASCSNLDESSVKEVEDPGEEFVASDAWICDIKSYQDDESWYYEMYLESNGDYIAVSNYNIIKVSSEGLVKSITLSPFSDDNYFVIRVFNNKIYRFYQNNTFDNFDPDEPIRLEIYDIDYNLLSDHELDSKGLIYDMEIESDNVFAVLAYDPSDYSMTLRKLDLNNGLIAENVLGSNGTSPNDLTITDDGFYICSASSNKKNLKLLDNDLNAIWENEFDQYVITDIDYVAGRGIYITGQVTPFVDPNRPSYVSLIDMNGNEVNAYIYDAGERWTPFIASSQDKICAIQVEPESGLNMLMTILDLDLNFETSNEIIGHVVQSDIVVNENNSFSFVYGIALDPNDPEFFPERNTRIFKFDESQTIPTNVIVQ